MEETKCPKCGRKVKSDAEVCPACGFDLKQVDDEQELFKELNESFGKSLSKTWEINEAKEYAKSKKPWEWEEYYQRQIRTTEGRKLARAYLTFLNERVKLDPGRLSLESLYRGVELLEEEKLLPSFEGDMESQMIISIVQKVLPYHEGFVFASVALHRYSEEKRAAFAKDGIPTALKDELKALKLPRLAERATLIALYSDNFKYIEGAVIEGAVSDIAEEPSLLDLFFLSSSPLAKIILDPFLSFYIRFCQNAYAWNSDASEEFEKREKAKAKRIRDVEREEEEREEAYDSLKDISDEIAADPSGGPDVDSVAQTFNAVLESVAKGEPFRLREVVFNVQKLEGDLAEVVFAYPHCVPFDVNAKNEILWTKAGLMDRIKKKPTRYGRILLRDGSVHPYEKSTVRAILNNAIWNELPPGLEEAFVKSEDGDRFVLLSEKELVPLLSGNKISLSLKNEEKRPYWVRDPSSMAFRGKAKAIGTEDGYEKATRLGVAMAKGTLMVSKLSSCAKELESFFAKRFSPEP